MRTLLLLLLAFAFQYGTAQIADVQDPVPAPAWFEENCARNVGLWIADNSEYMDEMERFEAYGIEWRWGLGYQHIEGELFGLQNGKRSAAFWKLVQYWDAGDQQVKVLQFAGMGAYGLGHLVREDESHLSLTQHFMFPDGSLRWEGHKTELFEGYDVGESLLLNDKGEWEKKRTYTWRKIDPRKQPIAERIRTRIDTLASGELSVEQVFEAEAPIERVWAAFATGKGAREWMAPLVEVDLRSGGAIRVNARPGGVMGDDQTLEIGIVNYVPQRMLTMFIDLSVRWKDIAPEEAANVYNMVEFEDLGDGRTRVTTRGLGYKADPRFARPVDYFVRGNLKGYANLLEYLEAEK